MTPRAVIHKQILDTARDDPNALLEELARRTPGATVELVDRVLDKYGDPCHPPEAESTTDDSAAPQAVTEEIFDELTEKQRETLRLISEHPTTLQREVAQMLDVIHTTVHHRLESIEGSRPVSRVRQSVMMNFIYIFDSLIHGIMGKPKVRSNRFYNPAMGALIPI